MAKERSDASSCPSKYSPKGWVTPSQFLVEKVCEQAARHTNTDLPLQFWKNDRWSKFFVSQTRQANKFIKKYDLKVLISVVKKNRVRSLLPKWVEGVIQKEQSKSDALTKLKDQQNLNAPSKRIIDKPKTRSVGFGKSAKSKLLFADEIDHGKEEGNDGSKST